MLVFSNEIRYSQLFVVSGRDHFLSLGILSHVYLAYLENVRPCTCSCNISQFCSILKTIIDYIEM